MSSYKLITFDMDGTLLNDSKGIPQRNVDAINEATAQGKIVCISSGRCMPEIRWLLEQVPAIRFCTGASGAFTYDTAAGRNIFRHQIPAELVSRLMKMTQADGIMPALMADEGYCQTNQIPLMPSFNVAQYKKLYEDVFTHIEDIYDFFFSDPFPVYKVNVYAPSPDICLRYKDELSQYGLECVLNEKTYLEVTAGGVSKGAALNELCEHIGISAEQAIAVGDEINDYGMLSAAGFAVAVGNANDRLKEIADAVVADNNSGGCADAILNYLLD